MLLVVLVFFLFFVLAIFFIIFSSRFVLKKAENDLDENRGSLEFIRSSEQVPPHWLRKAENKFGSTLTPPPGEKREELSPRQTREIQAYFLKRLEKLRRYYRRTNFVQTEEERKQVLALLDKVRDKWEQASLDDIIPTGGGPFTVWRG